MAKKIKFTYAGKNYVLEYNRETVKQMESRGFRLGELENQPVNTISMLFSGAFLMHHKNVARDKDLTDEIYASFKNRDELLSALIEMYQEPVAALFDEPEEDDAGNTTWGMEG